MKETTIKLEKLASSKHRRDLSAFNVVSEAVVDLGEGIIDAEEGDRKSGAIRKIRVPIRGNEGEFYGAPNSREPARSHFADRERE